MDVFIVNFFFYFLFCYKVKKDVYNGVNIEVYYYFEYNWNVDVMVKSVKDLFDYFIYVFGFY